MNPHRHCATDASTRKLSNRTKRAEQGNPSPQPKQITIIAENNTSFFDQVFSKSFLSTSSEFTFGDNSDKLSIFQNFFMNLVDRDLTEYQITQTLTLPRLHTQLEQTKGIRLFTHTQHVDWSRQGESDCLIIL